MWTWAFLHILTDSAIYTVGDKKRCTFKSMFIIVHVFHGCFVTVSHYQVFAMFRHIWQIWPPPKLNKWTHRCRAPQLLYSYMLSIPARRGGFRWEGSTLKIRISFSMFIGRCPNGGQVRSCARHSPRWNQNQKRLYLTF